MTQNNNLIACLTIATPRATFQFDATTVDNIFIGSPKALSRERLNNSGDYYIEQNQCDDLCIQLSNLGCWGLRVVSGDDKLRFCYSETTDGELELTKALFRPGALISEEAKAQAQQEGLPESAITRGMALCLSGTYIDLTGNHDFVRIGVSLVSASSFQDRKVLVTQHESPQSIVEVVPPTIEEIIHTFIENASVPLPSDPDLASQTIDQHNTRVLNDFFLVQNGVIEGEFYDRTAVVQDNKYIFYFNDSGRIVIILPERSLDVGIAHPIYNQFLALSRFEPITAIVSRDGTLRFDYPEDFIFKPSNASSRICESLRMLTNPYDIALASSRE